MRTPELDATSVALLAYSEEVRHTIWQISERARGEVSGALKNAVRELKLRLGHSPPSRVVEVDPWSRISERRHALLSFDP